MNEIKTAKALIRAGVGLLGTYLAWAVADGAVAKYTNSWQDGQVIGGLSAAVPLILTYVWSTRGLKEGDTK